MIKKEFKNLIELVEYFKTENDCIVYLKSILWKVEKNCPHCGSNKVMEFKDVKRNRCYECKKDFSIRKGTIFEDSNIPLKKWFMASYIYNAHKKGISSCQLAKDISVSQPTAWFMLQRLRFASKNRNHTQFEGINEIDEAYIGGSDANKHSNQKGKKDKTVVIGIVNRDTKQVKAFKVASAEKENLLPRVNINIKRGATIISDTFQGYKDLKRSYDHNTVKHSAGEYVKKNSRTAYKIHTNTIEGFWSQLKRGINGVYHWVSEKHMQQYCNEFSYRYNTRDLKDFERFGSFITNNIQCKLYYKSLVA
jgi:transposase-like protein